MHWLARRSLYVREGVGGGGPKRTLKKDGEKLLSAARIGIGAPPRTVR